MKNLSPLKVYEGRKRALQNALSLYEDANILFNAGRWSRAFFLTQIATEELGKYGILVSSSISLVHGSLDLNEFSKRFRSHKDKTINILLIEDIYSCINKRETKLFEFDQRKCYANIQEKVKMMSLYCDIEQDGTFTVPDEVINPQITETALKLLKSRIDIVTSFEAEIASQFKIEQLKPDYVDNFYNEIGLKINKINKK